MDHPEENSSDKESVKPVPGRKLSCQLIDEIFNIKYDKRCYQKWNLIEDINKNKLNKAVPKRKLKSAKKSKLLEVDFLGLNKLYGQYLEPLIPDGRFENNGFKVATPQVQNDPKDQKIVLKRPSIPTRKSVKPCNFKRASKVKRRGYLPKSIIEEPKTKGETTSKKPIVKQSEFKQSRKPVVQHEHEDLLLGREFPIDAEDRGCLDNCFIRCAKGEKLNQRPKSSPHVHYKQKQHSGRFRELNDRLGKILLSISDYLKANMETLLRADRVFTVPAELNSSSNFNYLAGCIWMLGFGIEKLYTNAGSQKNQATVIKLLNDFCRLAGDVDRVAKTTIRYSKIHYCFAKKIMKKLGKTSARLTQKFHPAELKVKKPIKFGKALEISSVDKETQDEIKELEILISKIQDSAGETIQANYSSAPFETQYTILYALMAYINAEIVSIASSMRFLIDDVEEERLSPNEPEFTTSINSFDLTIYRFTVLKESDSDHLEILRRVTRQAYLDIDAFVTLGEKVIHDVIEVRDMLELIFAHLTTVLPWDIRAFLPRSPDIRYALMKRQTKFKGMKSRFGNFCLTKEQMLMQSEGFNPEEFYGTGISEFLTEQKIRIEASGYDVMLGEKQDGTKVIPEAARNPSEPRSK